MTRVTRTAFVFLDNRLPLLIGFTFSLLPVVFGCLLADDRSALYLSVPEDLRPGSLLSEVPVEAGELRLVQGAGMVRLESGSKRLLLAEPLDRDQGLSKFEAVIECRLDNDLELPPLNISVFLSITDVNDNSPRFSHPIYEMSLAEESAIGSVVFTELEASDADADATNSFIQFSIIPGPFSHLLNIPDSTRPLVTVAARIDFEQLSNFSVEVMAIDGGSPSRNSTALLMVTVLDVDDLNPILRHQFYTATFETGHDASMYPEVIMAVDGDSLNAPIFYELSGESHQLFSIDEHGRLVFVSNTSTLSPPSTQLLVNAIQSDRQERRSTALLQVNGQSQQRFQFEYPIYSIQLITSRALLNSEIVHIRTISHGLSTNVSYSLVNETSNVFKLNASTGSLTLSQSPSQSAYHLRVSASDGETTIFCRVQVFVIDDRGGPVFDRMEYTLNVRQAPILGRVHVTNSLNVSYRLANFRKLFHINEDGVIRMLGDQLPSGLYELVVLAEDSTGNLALSRAILQTPTGALSATVVLTLLIFVLLIIIFLIIASFILRRVYRVWNRSKDLCWISRNRDRDVVISGYRPDTVAIADVSSRRPNLTNSLINTKTRIAAPRQPHINGFPANNVYF